MKDMNKETLKEMTEIVNENGLEGMLEVFRILLNEAMLCDRSQALGANPYERCDTRQGYANGFKSKRLQTRMGETEVQVPQVRGELDFYPSCLDKGMRSERSLKLALAEMYLQGVSTRKVTKIMQKLCGFKVTSAQVSRIVQELDGALEAWRNQPLGAFPYVTLDARYEKVRVDGKVRDCAILIAIGIDPEGKRSVLGVSVALSEAEVHWRSFLESLQLRGLRGLKLFVSDAHPGLKSALTSVFPSVLWQRCQFHLQQNAQQYITKQSLKKEVASTIRRIFTAEDRNEADRLLKDAVVKYSDSQTKLAEWMEENIPEGLTVLDCHEDHRKKLRTSNGLERLNREIKRRTRVVGIFPNEASLLRLVSALLSEQDDEWSTHSPRYLNMDFSTE